MKTKLAIAGLTSLAFFGGAALWIADIASKVNYEVLSYSVRYLDVKGVTFRVMFAVTNPTRFTVKVWNQRYTVFVSGAKVSEIETKEDYLLLKDSISTIPLDVRLNWSDLQNKLLPLGQVIELHSIADLPVLITGSLSAKAGIFRLSKIPVRATTQLGTFLP